jgi:hypothetical protein
MIAALSASGGGWEISVRIRLFIAALLVIWSTFAAAQEVYESKDKAGRPVFSDQPTPGAQPMDLPPPNVIEVPPTPSQQAPPTTAAQKPSYTSFTITSPANGDTIHTNTGAFDVGVAIAPALQADQGDVIRAMLDGNLLRRSYTSANFHVTEAVWQGAANPDNVEHTLQLAIFDATGAPVIESAPIRFYAHRATAARRPATR